MATETTFESQTAAAPGLVADTRDGGDEAALLVQARDGSPAAIEQLIGCYECRLFRLARNITGNHEDAEEVVQNALVKAFQNLAAFRGDCRFRTWIVRIAVNEALMKIRGQLFTEAFLDDGEDAEGATIPCELEDWGPNPEEGYSQEELRRILETTISELTPGNRIVFQLRDIEELSTEETAQALDLPLPTVKSRLRRARLQLRDLLDIFFRPRCQSVKNATDRFAGIHA
jgi:RNA polymerase sigma-70 factor (ECF subfamily)